MSSRYLPFHSAHTSQLGKEPTCDQDRWATGGQSRLGKEQLPAPVLLAAGMPALMTACRTWPTPTPCALHKLAPIPSPWPDLVHAQVPWLSNELDLGQDRVLGDLPDQGRGGHGVPPLICRHVHRQGEWSTRPQAPGVETQ
jgi:hypothetical protein